MRRIGLILCTLWPVIAVAQTGLEFLEPKKLAYVEVKGMVREYLTNAPIAGASVLAVWHGTTQGFYSSIRHCLRMDATRTRPDGSFSLVTPAKSVYRDGMSMQYVDIRIHRDGMEERFAPGKTSRTMKLIEDRRAVLSKLFGPKEVGLDLDARMVKVTEDIPDRLQTLNELSDQPTDCETKGDTAGILSFFGAPAAEAMSLAKTRYQRALAQAMTSYARKVFSSYNERSAAREAIQRAAYPLDPEDTEWRDEENRTPLMRAAKTGNVETVRALLASGANPNRTGRSNSHGGGSALTTAMEQLSQKRFYNAHEARRYGAVPTAGYPLVIHALLADPKTDVNLRDSQNGYTPLMKALTHSQDDVVAWLLAAGADPNLTAYDGKFSALGIALAAMGRKDADGKPLPSTVRQFELLLATKRVNLDIRYDGKTSLTGALSSCDIDMVKRLLEAGANPNAADVGRRTPLIVSIESSILNPRRPQYVECVRTIAAWPGVDYTALYAGKTALQMALDAGRADLVDILEKK